MLCCVCSQRYLIAFILRDLLLASRDSLALLNLKSLPLLTVLIVCSIVEQDSHKVRQLTASNK